MFPKKFFERIINYLSIIVIILATYFILSPFIPSFSYAFVRPDSESFEKKQVNQNAKPNLLRGEERRDISVMSFTPSISNEKNKLTIEKIGVDGEIHEGDNQNLLKLGIWHLPWTSSPEKGGNTVIVAHRFLKTSGPETFYFLDKIVSGDKIRLKWQGTTYEYEVYETKVVPPQALEIEAATLEPILTLYTCTPLWSSKDRLVVRAKLLD